MVKKYLSVVYKSRFTKSFNNIMSILTSLFVLGISIGYMIWGVEKKVEIIIFTQIIFLHLMIYNYFEIRSKDILYDEEKIYIKNGKQDFIEVSFDQIVKIKRFYLYFYQITFKDNLIKGGNKIYYVTPDPHTFYRQKELLEISRFAKKKW